MLKTKKTFWRVILCLFVVISIALAIFGFCRQPENAFAVHERDEVLLCNVHWLAIALFLIGTIVTSFFNSLLCEKDIWGFKTEKKDTYTIVSCSVGLVLSIVLAFFCKCLLCATFVIIDIAFFAFQIEKYVFSKQVDKQEEIKATENEVVSVVDNNESDETVVATDEIVPMKENSSVANEKCAKEIFTKSFIVDYLGKKYGDGVELNHRENKPNPEKGKRKGFPIPDTHYTLFNGGRKCFAYVYEKKDFTSLLIRVSSSYGELLQKNHSLVKPSAFPRSKDTWYSVAIDDTWDEASVCKMLDDVKSINEIEFK